MDWAPSLPAPMARMTVAAPVTASPPAYTPSREVQAVLVDDDAALLVDLQALGGGLDQGVGGGAQGHDDSVHVQLELAALHLHGAAAAGGVGLAQLHLGCRSCRLTQSLLVALDLDGVGQRS